ncbi:hypothetical protein NDN08_005627 [Rhodosorus marinus]|uniref:Uncharacterized protein n=1 Tax=Rhodosorus marinus TaxID=101924 RepID=A0AAV8V4H5_9RHOD|nr:hypothetical protein NDN08_005627 [Rhodosorus marinus]
MGNRIDPFRLCLWWYGLGIGGDDGLLAVWALVSGVSYIRVSLEGLVSSMSRSEEQNVGPERRLVRDVRPEKIIETGDDLLLRDIIDLYRK